MPRKFTAAAPRQYLPAVAMFIAVGLCVAFTTLNAQLARDAARQSVLASAFCVIACIMYLVFMIVSHIVAFVLSYVEHPSYSHLPDDGEVETLLWDEEVPPPSSKSVLKDLLLLQLRPKQEQALIALHRETVISSMYMGGCGAFMALPALCMWDMSVAVCFVLSLALGGFYFEEVKVPEFRANVDTAGAIAWLKRLRWAMYTSLLSTLVAIAWQDIHGTRFDETYNYYQRVAAFMRNATPTDRFDPDEWDNEGLLQWPLMLLATFSPAMLRLGSRTPSVTRLLMSPSQILEAGLPVSTLLAILVLGWYSPVDGLVVHDQLFSRLAIPMLILCPSCLAIILAFILRGFRKRHSGITATVLACACAIRQQAADRRMQTRMDWAVIACAAQTLAFLVLESVYRARVSAANALLPVVEIPLTEPEVNLDDADENQVV